MTRAAVFVASVGVVFLTVSVDARAEPIRITGGFLDFDGGNGRNQAGPLSIVGNRGFSVTGLVDAGEFPVDLLGKGNLLPGSTLSTGALAAGIFPPFLVTLDGHTYTSVNASFSLQSLFVKLSGTIDLPAWQNAPVTVTAPFDANGLFESHYGSTSFFRFPIQGGGTLILNLSPVPNGNWDLGTFRYGFVATPTPEPATLTLLTGGLVASALRARKRRDRKTRIQLSTSTPRA